MGNEQSKKAQEMHKPKIEFGMIDICFKNKEVLAGTLIQGRVNLTLVSVLHASEIKIRIIGISKCNICNTKKGKEHWKKLKHQNSEKQQFLKIERLTKSPTGSSFEPGAYSFPFKFKIPDDSPPTYYHFCNSNDSSASVKVQYIIEAEISNVKIISERKSKTFRKGIDVVPMPTSAFWKLLWQNA